MNRLAVIFIFIYYLSGTQLFSQECKVNLEIISNEYSGDCKRGEAHGEGIARGNGFVYEGEFKRGYPHGEGTLKMSDGSIFNGEWKRGDVYGYGTITKPDGEKVTGYFKGTITSFRYMGEDKSSLAGYKVLETERLENATYQFIKADEKPSTVNIQIFENRIRQITNFEILEITSGSIQLINNSGGRLNAEIVNVQYPVTMSIRYIIPYGTQDTTLPGGVDNLNSPRRMRFTIAEQGEWTLTITHR